jgi:hypothetical protein
MSSSRDRWASVKTGWRYFVTKTKWACSRKTQCLLGRVSKVGVSREMLRAWDEET